MLIREKEMATTDRSDTITGQNIDRREPTKQLLIEGVPRKTRVLVGDSIVRQTYKAPLNKDDVVVCFPGTRMVDVTERVEKVMGSGK